MRSVSWIGLFCLVAASACAKFPDQNAAAGTKRLTFTFTMDQAINPNFVYIVALRPSTDVNPTDQGPIPVIQPPWGNGFVAGNCTYFMLWNPSNSPAFGLYQFIDANLINYQLIGTPVVTQPVQSGDRGMRFDIDLSQLGGQTLSDTYKSIQINFLTMDRIPTGGAGSKTWDALGDNRLPSQINSPISIDLRTSGTYNNAFFLNLEPQGDTPDPTIDIIDFSVEVRLF